MKMLFSCLFFTWLAIRSARSMCPLFCKKWLIKNKINKKRLSVKMIICPLQQKYLNSGGCDQTDVK